MCSPESPAVSLMGFERSYRLTEINHASLEQQDNVAFIEIHSRGHVHLDETT